MPPHPRTDSSWPPREGSQVARGQLRSNNRAEAWLRSFPFWLVQFDNSFGLLTIPVTWAEGRATVGTDLSAVPGAKTEWGGTMPPSVLRDWHQSAKSSWLRSSPPCSPLIALYALLFILFLPSHLREDAALGIGLPFAQHVPDDRGQLAHHGNAGDGGSPAPLDPFEPLAQPSVLAQHLVRHLRQQPPRHAAAGLGDVAQPLGVLAAVAAAGREPPVVGQALRTRET